MKLKKFKEKFSKQIVVERVNGCDEKHGEGRFVYFKSECECCDTSDTNIYMRIGCEDCMNGSLMNLNHGGHYRSFVLFKDDKVMEFGGPRFEKPKERYVNIINENLESMKTKDVEKILKLSEDLS